MARGWIDKRTNETAAQLKTRLSGMADFFTTSLHGGSTIAYSANGLILRQREDVKTEECRGLTEAAALLLKGLESDNTSSVIHYKAVGDNGEYAVVGLVFGTKVTVSALRANEAAGWIATISTVTYSADSADGWTTTRPSSASSAGVVIDFQQTSERLYSALATASTAAGYGIAVLYQNADITTREYRFLTQAEAASLVSTLNASHIGAASVAQITVGGVTPKVEFKNYTLKKASARYVSPESGWTVTCIETVYSPGAYYNNTSNRWLDLLASPQTQITAAPYVPVSFIVQSYTNSDGQLVIEWHLYDS